MRRKALCHMVALVVLIIIQGSTASGFDQGDVMMHGFAGQGYLKSSDNNYLGNSKDGSYEFNEIGINFMVPVTDDLRFGIQLFSRDLGTYGNNDLVVDWALLDYNVNQYLGFRAGKVKMPCGMRNKSRDVDNLRTSVILNQAVYNESFREMLVAMYGGNIYGSTSLGLLGELDYEFLIGTIDISEDGSFLHNFIERMMISNPSFGGAMSMLDFSEISIRVKHIEGGQLIWNPPVSGLSFSVTNMIGTLISDFSGIDATTKAKRFLTLSTRYEFKNLSFIAEMIDAKYEFTLDIVPEWLNLLGLPDFSRQIYEIAGWYTEISCRATDRFYLGAAYGEFYPNADDKNGNQISKGEYPDYYAWQKDTTLSTKYNINEYLCVKFEVHFVDGLGLTEISANDPDESKRHWMLYAFKTSVNF